MLERLYLQDNSIQEIAPLCLVGAPLICHFDVSFNQIGSLGRGILSLSGLNTLSFLKTIQLQDNPLDVSNTALTRFFAKFSPHLLELSGAPVASKFSMEQSFEDTFSKLNAFMKLKRDPVLNLTSFGDGRGLKVHSAPFSDIFTECGPLLREYGSNVDASTTAQGSMYPSGEHLALIKVFMSLSSGVTTQRIKSKQAVKARTQNQSTELPLPDDEMVAVLWHNISSLLKWRSGAPYDSEVSDTWLCGIGNVSNVSMVSESANGDLEAETESSTPEVGLSGSEATYNAALETSAQWGDKSSLSNPSLALFSDSHLDKFAQTIQRIYRGYRVRNRFSRLMENIKYQDDDLDGVFDEDLDIMLNDLGDMSDFDDGPLVATKAAWGENNGGPEAVVFGDHRSLARWSQQPHHYPGIQVDRHQIGAPVSSSRGPLSRPMSAVSDISDAPSSRAHSVNGEWRATEGASPRARSEQSGYFDAASVASKESGKSALAKAAESDWGLSNPAAINAFMKRNRRLKYVVFLTIIFSESNF
jgi:hypothetical protein